MVDAHERGFRRGVVLTAVIHLPVWAFILVLLLYGEAV